MKTPVTPEIKALGETRLREITEADSADLTEFAECRLVALGASPSHGEDATQRAFLLVLQGLETDQDGRRPRLENLKDKPAFLNYLRGIISSVVHGMTRKCAFQAEHTPWNDEMPIADVADSPARRAELNDLRDQLFPRLRNRAQPRLKSTIKAWESVFADSDRVPSPGPRKYSHEVKALARDVLSELGGID